MALLGEAENIYVIGLRRSFSVASYLTMRCVTSIVKPF